MKKLLALSFLLLSCAAQTINTTTIYKSLVMAQIAEKNGAVAGAGSVFSIGNDLYLTANHVCVSMEKYKDAYTIQMMYFSAETNKLEHTKDFKILKTDAVNDICLVKISGVNAPSFKIAQEDSVIGSPVFSYGCAEKIFGFLTSGFLLDNNIRVENGRKVMMTSAPAWFGQSGGPVLNEYGEVIGITVSIFNEFHHIQLSPPTNVIREFIKEYTEK